jgi:Flp pilus assembly protein TadB
LNLPPPREWERWSRTITVIYAVLLIAASVARAGPIPILIVVAVIAALSAWVALGRRRARARDQPPPASYRQ